MPCSAVCALVPALGIIFALQGCGKAPAGEKLKPIEGGGLMLDAGKDFSDGILAFVGTGGCDGEDDACVEGPPAHEKIIQPMRLGKDGSVTDCGDKSLWIRTPGLPVWLTTVGTDLSGGCLFATLADKSKIFSYGQGTSITVDSGGVNPVYASVTEDGKTLLVANYHGPDDAQTSDGASVASFAIGPKCSLTLADVKNHEGSSIVTSRQGGAHVHAVVAARDGLAFAIDLGMDKIFTYAVGPDSKLTEMYQTETTPGSGPRHLVQHPILPYVYVVNELTPNVVAYEQQSSGALEEVQSESLVVAELGDGTGSKAAEIAVSPDGSLLFATNRGSQNTVTVFQISANGKLTRKAYVETVAFPRGMSLVADGSVLLVGGQSQSEVESYSVGDDGSLTRVTTLQKDGCLPAHPATFTTFGETSPKLSPMILYS